MSEPQYRPYVAPQMFLFADEPVQSFTSEADSSFVSAAIDIYVNGMRTVPGYLGPQLIVKASDPEEASRIRHVVLTALAGAGLTAV